MDIVCPVLLPLKKALPSLEDCPSPKSIKFLVPSPQLLPKFGLGFCRLQSRVVTGNALMVQWLGLFTFTAVPLRQVLVGKLKFCRLCCTAPLLKKSYN